MSETNERQVHIADYPVEESGSREIRNDNLNNCSLVYGLSRRAKSAFVAAAGGAEYAAETLAHGAGLTADAITSKASDVAASVSSKASEAVNTIKEHSRESVVKKAKVASFRDGVNEGASLMADRAYAYSLALVALTMYVARSDGDVSEREVEQIESSFRHLRVDENIPEAVRRELDGIACDEKLAFDDVSVYLDRLGVSTLESLKMDLECTVAADGKCTSEEEVVRIRFAEYVEMRRRAEGGEDG